MVVLLPNLTWAPLTGASFSFKTIPFTDPVTGEEIGMGSRSPGGKMGSWVSIPFLQENMNRVAVTNNSPGKFLVNSFILIVF
jgi:hypothetical protein